MTLFKLASSLAVAGVVLSVFGTTAYATNNNTVVEQEQKLNQTLEIECEVGAYGQTSKCTAKGEQSGEQKQKIVFKNGTVLGKVHVPVDTALDYQTMGAALVTMGTGASAVMLKRKIA
ncbi:hypothetical protein KBC79_04815 [Candidatus Woesebacteria bacterium]|nr:hypothetical protein [Candidatus Woesebacteria bacterium]